MSTPRTSPRPPSTAGRCGPEMATRRCSAGSTSVRSGSPASPSSHNRASYAAARRRPRCTCTWGAPTHGSSGPTTARRYTRRPATSHPGTKPCWWPPGAPQAPHGRKSSAPAWCPRTPVDDFLHHMLRLGDFAWELRNHRLEQLLREPLSAAAWAHRWLTAVEGDHPPPPPRSLPPCREWHWGVPATRGPPPVPGPAGGVLEAPTRRPPPSVDHQARLHDRVGGTHSG